MRRAILSLLGLALLAGCAASPPKVTVPDIVTKEVDRYVPIPAMLVAHPVIEAPADQTYGEAYRMAVVRRSGLEQCYGQLDQIATLKGGVAQP
jgi:hypothetical protein